MKTLVIDNLGLEVEGYVINSGFSVKSKQRVAEIQAELNDKFGDSVWSFPQTSLHITLMDWFAPLVSYDEGSNKLFNKYRNEYEKVLENILSDQSPIKIHFDTIKVSPSAVYIQGTDDGSYEMIRKKFLQKIQLVEGTKKSPQIIHSSIARFNEEINLHAVQDFVVSLDMDLYETISEFRLVKETKVPMLEFEVIRTFKLSKN